MKSEYENIVLHCVHMPFSREATVHSSIHSMQLANLPTIENTCKYWTAATSGGGDNATECENAWQRGDNKNRNRAPKMERLLQPLAEQTLGICNQFEKAIFIEFGCVYFGWTHCWFKVKPSLMKFYTSVSYFIKNLLKSIRIYLFCSLFHRFFSVCAYLLSLFLSLFLFLSPRPSL